MFSCSVTWIFSEFRPKIKSTDCSSLLTKKMWLLFEIHIGIERFYIFFQSNFKNWVWLFLRYEIDTGIIIMGFNFSSVWFFFCVIIFLFFFLISSCSYTTHGRHRNVEDFYFFQMISIFLDCFVFFFLSLFDLFLFSINRRNKTNDWIKNEWLKF